MSLLELGISEFENFSLVFFRVTALIIFMPVLGSGLVPRHMKVGMIFFLTLAIFPMVEHLPRPELKGLFSWTIYFAIEALIGMALAFAARGIFAAVQVAGTIVDFQMGFGVVNVIDPQTNTQVSITAQFQNILTILIFLVVDAHHFIIQAIYDSFVTINPATIQFADRGMEVIMHLFVASFATATKIAAPLMAILFFLSVGLGMVARTVPQMNVFIVGFPLQIGVGLLMTGLSTAFFTRIVSDQFLQYPKQLFAVLQSF